MEQRKTQIGMIWIKSQKKSGANFWPNDDNWEKIVLGKRKLISDRKYVYFNQKHSFLAGVLPQMMI